MSGNVRQKSVTAGSIETRFCSL